jgi:uncharacterized membrane protein
MGEPKRIHMVFLGFPEEQPAAYVLELIREAMSRKEITVDDYAMVHKAPGGKLTITDSKSKDPGAARGAVAGGTAGMVLAALSGPIGVGAVAAGAAIGAVTAAVRDSGIKTDQVKEISKLMADGRTGIMLAMPIDAAGQWDEFVSIHPEFAASDRQHQVDIVPGRDFEDALEEYRHKEAEEEERR